tara:strand:+ start:1116 stop:2018 length:903 start_codon:yes stop_codon:yes gene_type:complete
MSNKLRLGTRGSKLALIQADIVSKKLFELDNTLSIDIIPIQTEGDINTTQPLHEIGGKGVFIKSLEHALIKGEVDAAIHSVKDITSTIANNTELVSFLTPEARTDCVICHDPIHFNNLKELPLGYSFATSSLRRKAILLSIRPDFIIKDIRGNVQTRIEKCKSGYADALLLSTAGVIRLGMNDDISLELSPTEFTPAPGQGVIGIQLMKNNSLFRDLFLNIGCDLQRERHFYEHMLVSKVGLDCNYPLGVYVCVNDGIVTMRVCWATLDCKHFYSQTITGDKKSMFMQIDNLVEKIKKDI